MAKRRTLLRFFKDAECSVLKLRSAQLTDAEAQADTQLRFDLVEELGLWFPHLYKVWACIHLSVTWWAGMDAHHTCQ